MTKAQLAKMGIHNVRNNLYSVEAIRADIILYPNPKIAEVIKAIYDEGVNRGNDEGRSSLVTDLRNLLEI